MAESKLAPHAGKLTTTPADQIPIDKLKLPAGFKVELWATELPGARAMALSDDGKKVWLGTRGLGRVYEVSDNGDKRTVRTVADKLTQPAGVAYKGGALYVFAIDKVLKFDGIADRPNVEPQDLTAKFDLPPQQHHNWKYATPGIPSIAGQPKVFLETQLVLIREELRPAPQMLPIVKGMSDDEIVRLAEHFSKLPPRATSAGTPDPKLMQQGPRCLVWQASGRITCTRTCGPIGTGSEKAATPSWRPWSTAFPTPT